MKYHHRMTAVAVVVSALAGNGLAADVKGTNNWQEPLRPGPQDLGFDYYFGLPVVNSAPPYVYVENDRVLGGDPADPLVFLGRARGSGGFTGSKPSEHAWGGPPAVQFVGGINSDIENGRLKEDAPPAQLYDLEADVNQTRNLHDELPEVVKEMSTLLATYPPPKRIKGPRKGKAAATIGAAKRAAATPSARSASFDFEGR